MQLHSTLDKLKEDGVIDFWRRVQFSDRYVILVDGEKYSRDTAGAWRLVGTLRP